MSKCKFLREPIDIATWYSCKQDDFRIKEEYEKICKDECEKCKYNGGQLEPQTYQMH